MVIECSNCHARYNVDENKIPASGVKVKCHKCQHIIVISKESSKPEPAPEPVQPTPAPIPDVPDTAATVPSEASLSEPEPPSIPQPEVPDTPPSEPESPAIPQPEVPDTSPQEPKPPSSEPALPESPSEEPPVEPEIPVPEPAPEPDIPASAPSESLVEPTVVPPGPVPQALSEEPSAPPAAALSEEDKKWHERARRLAKALASDLVLYNQEKVEEGIRSGTLADLLGSEIRRSWEYYCQQIPKHIVESTDHFKDQLNKIVGKGKEIFK